MDNKENGGELAVVEDTTTAAANITFDYVDPEDAAAFMDNFQEVCEAMLKDSDYQQIGEKKTKKKSAWRKLATAFKVSDEIVNEQLIFDDVDGQIVTARYKVRATLPNGRSTIGVGVCSIYDKIRYNPTKYHDADTETPSNFVLRGRFSHAEHDVPSTAHTRAKNRAIADLIGAGEVSAEELEDEPVRVTRSSKKENNNSNNNDESNGKEAVAENAPKRTRRRRRTPPKENEDNVIETVAEVVQNEDENRSSPSLKELADNNSTIKKAVQRIQEEEAIVTKAEVVDEVFRLFDLGKITLEEYDEANNLLLN